MGWNCKLSSPLGTAYIAARGYAAPEVGPVFVHARELCERIGQPPQLFAVVWGNFAWHVVRGEMGLSMDLAREAIDLAERFEDPGIWMEALFLLGLTLFYRGDFIGALAQYEKALSHYDDRERTALWASHVGQDAGITHRCYLALALWQLGYPEQARRVSKETLKLARAIKHPFSLAYAQHHTSWLYHQLRLPAETKAASEEGIQTATEQGFAMFHATGTLYKAAGVLLEGRPNEALPLLTRGLEAYRATGAGLALPYYLSILGDAYIQAGRPDEARDVLDEGLAIAERSDELCQKAELYRLKGELALRTGSQNGEAEEHFRRAIGTARHQLSKAWELRATTSLARLCQQQGRRDEARQMLSDTYGRFTEGFNTPDLKAAKALLHALDFRGQFDSLTSSHPMWRLHISSASAVLSPSGCKPAQRLRFGVGGLPSFREEVQSLCIGIASHRAKRLQHRLISRSTICHAKAGSWLGDGDFLVTHFDRHIVRVAAQNRVDLSTRRRMGTCRRRLPARVPKICFRRSVKKTER